MNQNPLLSQKSGCAFIHFVNQRQKWQLPIFAFALLIPAVVFSRAYVHAAREIKKNEVTRTIQGVIVTSSAEYADIKLV